MSDWVRACRADDLEEEDVIPVVIDGREYAVYRSPDSRYYATDGLCTHEAFRLAEGLVIDNIIECPKHNGRFDYTTGQGMGAPICENLGTYRVKLEGGDVYIELS